MSSIPFRPRNAPIRAALAALFFSSFFSPSPAGADLASLRSQVESLRRSGSYSIEQQQSVLNGLEPHAKRFYDLVTDGEDAQAKALFDSLYPTLKSLYDYNQSKTESMVQGTIAADGDLEATQSQPDFKNAELARLRTLYHLNWVSYLGATLLPQGDGRRKALLDFAAEHFGEFVIGPDAQVAREALAGRAQALKELGRTEQALVDFRRLIELGPSSPGYAQARLGLAETALSSGNPMQAAREAQAVVSDATAGQLPAHVGLQAKLLRAQALFLALKKGQVAKAARQETVRTAVSTLREVEREGGAWKRKAQAIADWGLQGVQEASAAAGSGFAGATVAQSLMLKGQYGKALEIYEKALAAPAGLSPEERAHGYFNAGVAAFQLNRHAQAAKHLRAFLDLAPRSNDAGEATYLLFKALEQVAKTKRELEPAFRTALRTFLERYPGHSANAEARFRQAELLRDAGDVTAAVQEFRKVKGNPTLEFYAEFNAAQAMFTRLHEPPPNVRPEQLEQERRETVERLASLVKRLEKHRGGAVPVEELGAKTSLMAAILATEGKAPDYKKALDLTANFAKRFPGRPELARQAFALEILALLHVADPKRAEQALTGYLEAFGGAEKDRKKLLKRLGREFYAQSEAQRAEKRIELANASARVAIEIYERLRVTLEADAASLHALRGIQAMLGELYAEIGEDPQAAEEYARLLQIDAASPEALRGLAEIAARAGNHAKSSDYWSALAKTMDRKDPEWLDARYAAAREARAAGNAGSACHVVQETRELSPYPLIGGHKVRFGELERQVCAG